MIAVLSNLNCVLVIDKKAIDSSTPPPEYVFLKSIKNINLIDTTQVKTDRFEVIKIECNNIPDSNTVPSFFHLDRYAETFHLKSFPCGDCPTGYIDKKSNSDTLVYTFNLTDSCKTKCSQYHLFVEGDFANYQFIRKIEIVTMNQITDTIEYTIKNDYNWLPQTPGQQRYRSSLEE